MIKFSNYNVLAIINVIINLLSIIRFIRRFDEFKHKPIMHHAFIVLIVICFSTALSFFPESLVLKQYILYLYGLLYLSTVHLFHKEIIPFYPSEIMRTWVLLTQHAREMLHLLVLSRKINNVNFLVMFLFWLSITEGTFTLSGLLMTYFNLEFFGITAESLVEKMRVSRVFWNPLMLLVELLFAKTIL